MSNKNLNFDFLITSYISVMREMQNNFSPEQIEIINDAINTFSTDAIRLFFNPELSADRMEMVIMAMTEPLKPEQTKEIADPKLSDEDAKIIFDYYMLKASCADTETDCNDTDFLKALFGNSKFD